jgi:ElaB/YqjD/DUF883 family membrane-anchored ribosome-binding protein
MPRKPRTIKDDLEEAIAGVDENLETLGENAGRFTREIIDESHHLGDAADAVVAAIREKPIKSAIVALGVGALLGMLLRR